ncbi:MAG TPA: hypothetical protein VF736_10085 [Pyrinomonadaceae bacterium]|jgi:hypothetical protein
MSTHEDSLTHTEEAELTDEQILSDMQRRMRAATLEREFDARSLAVRVSELYSAGRERGVIDERGYVLDDILLANLASIHRLRDDEGSEAVNFFVIALPVVGVIITLLLFPSLLNMSGGLFQRTGLVVGVIMTLLAGVVAVALFDSKCRERWLEEGKLFRHHQMALLVGVMIAGIVTVMLGHQTEKAGELAAREREARHRAEEARLRAEDELKSVSLNSKRARSIIAHERLFDFSREVMQEQQKTGSFEKASHPETLPVGDKKIKVTQQNVSRDEVKYRAEGEPLPKPVEITMNKESGRVLEEGKETGRFYAAVVKDNSGGTLRLSVRNGDGSENSLTWPTESLGFQPIVGQKLFVVVDPKTNRPVDVTEFEPDSKKNETNHPH